MERIPVVRARNVQSLSVQQVSLGIEEPPASRKQNQLLRRKSLHFLGKPVRDKIGDALSSASASDVPRCPDEPQCYHKGSQNGGDFHDDNHKRRYHDRYRMRPSSRGNGPALCNGSSDLYDLVNGSAASGTAIALPQPYQRGRYSAGDVLSFPCSCGGGGSSRPRRLLRFCKAMM